MAQQILLYNPMIEWVAKDIARETRIPVEIVTGFVHYMVQSHEAIHAVIHLGLDGKGEWWKDPGEGSLAFHESLTEWMLSLWLVRQLDVRGRTIHSTLVSRLPDIYRLGFLLPDVSEPGVFDGIRHWLLTHANEPPDILKVSADVIGQAIRALDGPVVNVEEENNIRDGLMTILETLGNHGSVFTEVGSIVKALKQLLLIPKVWRQIMSDDPGLVQIFLNRHLLECAAFASACESDLPAGDSLRVLTQADLREHLDALVLRHREEELNQLLLQLSHRRELLSRLKRDRKKTKRAAGQPNATSGPQN
jgi:hypothetical protein